MKKINHIKRKRDRWKATLKRARDSGDKFKAQFYCAKIIGIEVALTILLREK